MTRHAQEQKDGNRQAERLEKIEDQFREIHEVLKSQGKHEAAKAVEKANLQVSIAKEEVTSDEDMPDV